VRIKTANHEYKTNKRSRILQGLLWTVREIATRYLKTQEKRVMLAQIEQDKRATLAHAAEVLHSDAFRQWYAAAEPGAILQLVEFIDVCDAPPYQGCSRCK
jgi:hypothetical protein